MVPMPIFGELDFEPLSPNPSHVICVSAFDNSRSPDGFKLRVESLARNYMNGGRLPIRSASLRGPFSSTWLNPWARSITSQEQERRRKRGEFAKARFAKQEKRNKDKLDRERRAKILRADGRGNTLNKPVDLTEDPEAAEIVRSFSVASSTSATFEAPKSATDLKSGAEPVSEGGSVLLQLHRDKARTGQLSRTPSPRPDDNLRFESRFEPFVYGNGELDAPDRAEEEEISHPFIVKQPILHSVAILDESTAAMVAQPSPINADSVEPVPNEERSPSVDVDARIRYLDKPQSMPTPSDSGNEGRAALMSDRQVSRATPPEFPLLSHARSPFLFSGFTPVAQAEVQSNLKRKRDPDTAQDRTFDLPSGNPQASLKPHIDHAAITDAVVNRALQSIALDVERTCSECGIGLPPRGWTELCRTCKRRQSRNSRKTMVSHPYESEQSLSGTVDSVPSPVVQRNLRPSKHPAQLSMSQPGPITRPLLPSSKRHIAPASSFPTTKSKQPILNHQRVLRRMFPLAENDSGFAMDEELAELLGRNGVRPSQIIRDNIANAMQIPADEGVTATGADFVDGPQAPEVGEQAVVPKTKPKPKRMMTFDTPVVRRETRSQRKVDVSTDSTGISSRVPDAVVPESKQPPEVATNNTERMNPPKSPITSPTIVASGSAITPGTAVRLGVLSKEPITPRSKSRKVLEEHTNKVFSIYDGTRMRQLVRKSAGVLNNIHEDHTEEARPEAGGDFETPEYVSTQDAMLEAQFAFQQNLNSPLKDDVRTWQDEIDVGSQRQPLQSCNITPFHALQSSDEGSSQPGAEINTQALFDNFLISQDSGCTPYGQTKRASFGVTPLGPADRSSQPSDGSKTGKSCLKSFPPRSLFGRGAMKSSHATTPLSNLGLGVLNAQTESDPDELNPFITGAAAFLGS